MNQESPYLDYSKINESIPGSFDKTYYDKTAEEYFFMYKSIMPVEKRACFLDIGCGKGFFLYYLKQHGYTNFYGIDADQSSIDFTKKEVSENCERIHAAKFLS